MKTHIRHKGKIYDETVNQEILKKIDYDDKTGVFTWKKIDVRNYSDKMFNTKYAGKIAGHTRKTKNQEGYVHIHVAGFVIKAHRIAWFVYYGEWPILEIDHVNQNRSDNRIENLRLVDRVSQNRNTKRRRDNSSGVTGVSFDKRINKWIAYISDKKQVIRLGSFVDKTDAIIARKEAEELLGYSNNHGSE